MNKARIKDKECPVCGTLICRESTMCAPCNRRKNPIRIAPSDKTWHSTWRRAKEYAN